MTNFYYEINDIKEKDKIYNRIINKSYKENSNISLDKLVYIKLNYYNFNNEIVEGELIVNKLITNDIINIFKELFENKYQINSIKLIDDYWINNGVESDINSIKHNNSSAFNYRNIPNTNNLSHHALGLAIDINPRQNPYVVFVNGQRDYSNFDEEEIYYAENRVGDHVITHDDLCYKVFIKYGFTWGGDWNHAKDYQHFEKIN